MLSPGIFHTHALPTLPAQGYYTSSSLTLGKATDTHSYKIGRSFYDNK